MQQKNILLVDEQPLILASLTSILSDVPGINVCGTARDGKTAQALVDELCPEMMILDVSLGKMHGLELIKRVAQNNQSIRILVLSALDDSLFAPRVLDAGALGYINKRNSVEEIVDAVQMVLNGQVYLSQRTRRSSDTEDSNVVSIHKLSDRELEVFHLIGQGMTTSDLANRLELSVKTIETHKANIKSKLKLKSGNELQVRAISWGLEQF